MLIFPQRALKVFAACPVPTVPNQSITSSLSPSRARQVQIRPKDRRSGHNILTASHFTITRKSTIARTVHTYSFYYRAEGLLMEEQQEQESTANKLIIHIPPSGKRLLADGQLIRKKSIVCTAHLVFLRITSCTADALILARKMRLFFLPSLSRDNMQPSVPLGPRKRVFCYFRNVISPFDGAFLYSDDGKKVTSRGRSSCYCCGGDILYRKGERG